MTDKRTEAVLELRARVAGNVVTSAFVLSPTENLLTFTARLKDAVHQFKGHAPGLDARHIEVKIR